MTRVGWLALVAALTTVGTTSSAYGQSFYPATFSGTRTVSFPIASSELVWDRRSSARYSRGIEYRRRLIGNAAVNTLALNFSMMDLNLTINEGWGDELWLRWDDYGPISRRWGSSTAPLVLAASSSPYERRLQWPGARLEFHTDSADQAAGFSVTSIAVTTGTPIFAPPVVLQVYERLSAVLFRDDDLIDLRLPSRAEPITIAVWPQVAGTGVRLYARCNAYPTATAFDKMAQTTATQPIFMELSGCSGGGWLLSITNTSSSDRLVHLSVGTHYPAREYHDVKVGVAFVSNATQRATITRILEEAAWRIYGATMGTHIIRSYDIYGTSACDDGWPADEYACGGGGCQICIQDEPGGSNCDYRGRIDLYGDDWFSNTLAHELGHCHVMSLPDEYELSSQPCPMGATWAMDLCGNSIMGQYRLDNIQGLCTPRIHRLTTDDCRSGSCVSAHGPDGWECNGTRHWIDATSSWSRLSSSGRVPVPHPDDRNPDNFNYLLFTAGNWLGQSEFL